MQKKAKRQSGAGDVIATITTAIGIVPCDGCNKRKSLLNVWFPFNTPKPLTDNQKKRIETEPLNVYNEAFGTNIEEESFTGAIKNSIIKKLDKLQSYENN